MKREKLEHLVTTGMNERKRSRGKQQENVGWTNKVDKIKRCKRCTKSEDVEMCGRS